MRSTFTAVGVDDQSGGKKKKKKKKKIELRKRISSPLPKSFIFCHIHLNVKENGQEQSIMVG